MREPRVISVVASTRLVTKSVRGASEIPNLKPRFNACPTDPADTIIEHDDKRHLVEMRWGLVPFWWSKPLKELRLASFNARVETVTTKPFFREPFKKKRCIMPVSGCYERPDLDARYTADCVVELLPGLNAYSRTVSTYAVCIELSPLLPLDGQVPRTLVSAASLTVTRVFMLVSHGTFVGISVLPFMCFWKSRLRVSRGVWCGRFRCPFWTSSQTASNS